MSKPPSSEADPRSAMQSRALPVATLSFFRFETPGDRLWAFGQMQFARKPLSRLPGIGFHKLMGTGTGESFTPLPNFGVYAILATWPSMAVAEALVDESSLFRRYRSHAAEAYTVFVEAVSASGTWDGRSPFAVAQGARGLPRPIGVLTRATVHARALRDFWRDVPAISLATRNAPGMRFKMGMGEMPLFNQVTFSIWDDAQPMIDFAYKDNAHKAAIQRAREGGWFREDLFARFRILAAQGTWQGADPLEGAMLDRQTSAA